MPNLELRAGQEQQSKRLQNVAVRAAYPKKLALRKTASRATDRRYARTGARITRRAKHEQAPNRACDEEGKLRELGASRTQQGGVFRRSDTCSGAKGDVERFAAGPIFPLRGDRAVLAARISKSCQTILGEFSVNITSLQQQSRHLPCPREQWSSGGLQYTLRLLILLTFFCLSSFPGICPGSKRERQRHRFGHHRGRYCRE